MKAAGYGAVVNRGLVVGFLVLFAVMPCAGRLITVDDDGPADFNTIQAAIDNASTGDTVVVAPGRYTGQGNFNISFMSKAITVRSTEPNDPCVVAATVVDCNNGGTGFILTYSADANRALQGLTIINGSASKGGAISWAGEGMISNCVISNCRAGAGGGIFISGILPEPTAGPTISNCVIKSNIANSLNGGGGIYCKWVCATIIDCEIAGNYAALSGGGIYSDGISTITRCIISGNRADVTQNNEGGGGIFCLKGGALITDCLIENNSAFNGGGIFTPMYLTGGRIRPPLPPEKQKTIIRDCIVRENIATDRGAGIFCSNSGGPDYITGCRIHGNRVEQGDGGGAFCEMYSSGFFANCIFSGNTAVNGGGLYSEQVVGDPQITNCTYSGNVATVEGGGLWMVKPWVVNSIFWGNTAGSGSIADAQLTAVENEDVEFNCIQDDDSNDAIVPFGSEDNNNIDEDPMFVSNPDDGGDGWGDNPETPGIDEGANDDYGDLHLRKCSPCINAGPAGWVSEPNSVDIDGQERIIGPAVDMGADEYSPMIVVTRPQAGEVWAAGSNRKIEWYSHDVCGVDVLFSGDGGGDWQVIAGGVSGVSSYMWDVPMGVDSNECVVRVEPGDGNVTARIVNSGIFSVRPYPQRPWSPPGLARRDRSPGAVTGVSSGPEIGCVQWTFETDGAVWSAVTVGGSNIDSRLYVGSEDGKVYGLNFNGKFLWSYDANTAFVGSPAVGYFGMLYAGGEDGWLYALDKQGRLRWTFTTGEGIYSSAMVSGEGQIYAGSQDGVLYSLAGDGSELWSFETAGLGKLKGVIFATPVLGADGSVYVAGLYDPNLYALQPDGEVKWVCNFDRPVDPGDASKGKIGGWPFASPAVGQDGTIYQTLLYDSHLYAIDANDGGIVWATDLADVSSGFFEPNYVQDYCGADGWSSPVVSPDETIYVSFDDPYLRAVSPDGEIIWVKCFGTVGGFTLTVDREDKVYAASDDGFVYVVNSDGEQLGRFEGEGMLSYLVIVRDDLLVVSDSNNRVWAIGERGCDGRRLALHSPADIDGDRAVGYGDLVLLSGNWLSGPAGKQNQDWQGREISFNGDVNRDMYVNFRDFALLAGKWMDGF